MKPQSIAARVLALAGAAAPAWAGAQDLARADADGPVRSGGIIVITATGQPTALPTQIPTTMESIGAEQIARTINASDSEDALKYFPSLLVRKRYIGDYNHAVLSSRASGTGNSARSAVYADGLLLSNHLGNGVGGLSFAPRWGMVTPAEIERVDVMYGPFSAAYPGNSVGAVVVYTTRMPTTFEVHARAGFSSQPFSLYNTSATYNAWEASVGVGNKSGDWAWLLDASHARSHSQPLTFATRLLSAGSTTAAAATPAATGAVLDANNAGQPWYVVGTGTEYRSTQDHIKAKLAYDITPTLRGNYVLGIWRNDAEGRPAPYLRDGNGAPLTTGSFSVGGLGFAALGAADFYATDERLTHVMHGLALKSHTRGSWDWQADASLYDYRKDAKRQSTGTQLGFAGGGPGLLADGSGTGWVNLALKGTWRPQGLDGAPAAHVVDAGVQHDRYRLRYLTTTLANWVSDPGDRTASNLAGNVSGTTQLLSLYAQDAWAFAPQWKTVLGLRAEQWRADSGTTEFATSTPPTPPTPALLHPSRRQSHLSPKAALAWQAGDALVLKASAGRAVRMPTVAELYGATATTNAQFINDPQLRPERSWTTELTAEQDLGRGLLRLTLFTEDTHDALYSQTLFDAVANRNVSRVQNVGRIATQGVEAAYSGSDVGMAGLDLNGSVTYADSVIKQNAGFVVTPGDTVGKQQPNIPRWRATALASYRLTPQWTASLGARYSGRQYRTLNNADSNGPTYQGVSRYFTADVRLHWRIDKQWSAAVGIDNLNNDKYWNFHPYPQRSYSAELKFDL